MCSADKWASEASGRPRRAWTAALAGLAFGFGFVAALAFAFFISGFSCFRSDNTAADGEPAQAPQCF